MSAFSFSMLHNIDLTSLFIINYCFVCLTISIPSLVIKSPCIYHQWRIQDFPSPFRMSASAPDQEYNYCVDHPSTLICFVSKQLLQAGWIYNSHVRDSLLSISSLQVLLPVRSSNRWTSWRDGQSQPQEPMKTRVKLSAFDWMPHLWLPYRLTLESMFDNFHYH